jgi:acyl-coenzyme A thioesterase PaaI-like protein
MVAATGLEKPTDTASAEAPTMTATPIEQSAAVLLAQESSRRSGLEILDAIRAVTVETGTILASGTVLHQGRRTATAEGRLVRATDGALLAHATSTLLVQR